LRKLLQGKEQRTEMMNAYDQLITLLGKEGCSEKMAVDLIQYLN
jgi:hypothetical protein